ncbi:preprotein translocase subunit YajC [Listeria costaricensis]|uniref:preprotein translocase subunit YajC n=1 Tax=Listeria costaricensis TaxID=2026604 RepID=UPI000C087F8D|nr:preprotein translocase subunit YajC [Listeria costaricensis]
MQGLAAFIPIILMIVLFYFLLIRPQQKRQKEVTNMQSGLQKGDKIITIGGLHGVIEAIEDNTVILKCGNAKLTFDRNAIRSVLEKAGAQPVVAPVEPKAEEPVAESTEVTEEQK